MKSKSKKSLLILFVSIITIIFIVGVIFFLLTYNRVYEIQIEKARDITRINDLRTLQSWIEQVFQDTISYPTQESLETSISPYIFQIPVDPLHGQIINGCKFWYDYEPIMTEIWIMWYKLSACLENDDYIESKAMNDGWLDDNKFEIGIWF